MYALFVSVAALIIASAGAARHIWRRHKQAEEGRAPRMEEETQVEEGQ
jgi:hypothetical protein